MINHPPGVQHTTESELRDTINWGSIVAITISWSLNHSILWCILHGLCSWLYVIYYGIFL